MNFLRFWRETQDRLFAFFAAAFFLLAASRAAFGAVSLRDSHGDYLYWVRLAAFSIFLAAILDKNLFQNGSDA